MAVEPQNHHVLLHRVARLNDALFICAYCTQLQSRIHWLEGGIGPFGGVVEYESPDPIQFKPIANLDVVGTIREELFSTFSRIGEQGLIHSSLR